jgi:hypothetical protein
MKEISRKVDTVLTMAAHPTFYQYSPRHWLLIPPSINIHLGTAFPPTQGFHSEAPCSQQKCFLMVVQAAHMCWCPERCTAGTSESGHSSEASSMRLSFLLSLHLSQGSSGIDWAHNLTRFMSRPLGDISSPQTNPFHMESEQSLHLVGQEQSSELLVPHMMGFPPLIWGKAV